MTKLIRTWPPGHAEHRTSAYAAYVSIRQYTSAYASITWSCGTLAVVGNCIEYNYVSIRQHTSKASVKHV